MTCLLTMFRIACFLKKFLSGLEHENIPLRYSKSSRTKRSRTKPLPAYSSV